MGPPGPCVSAIGAAARPRPQGSGLLLLLLLGSRGCSAGPERLAAHTRVRASGQVLHRASARGTQRVTSALRGRACCPRAVLREGRAGAVRRQMTRDMQRCPGRHALLQARSCRRWPFSGVQLSQLISHNSACGRCSLAACMAAKLSGPWGARTASAAPSARHRDVLMKQGSLDARRWARARSRPAAAADGDGRAPSWSSLEAAARRQR